MEQDPLRRGVAELIGTFTLLFVGAGSILTVQNIVPSAPGDQLALFGLVGVALAHGLAIGIMASALGHISGAHFNPAITFAFLITRRITALLAGVYWLAQLSGATAAVLLLRWIYPAGVRNASHIGAPALAADISVGKGLLVEVVLTFFLCLVIFASAVDARGSFKSIAGLGIGLTITMGVLIGGPLTGAALNPARAFGPQLVGDFWAHGSWIYYAGPLLGASIAGLLYEYLYLRPLEPEPVGPPESGVLEPAPGEAAAS